MDCECVDGKLSIFSPPSYVIHSHFSDSIWNFKPTFCGSNTDRRNIEQSSCDCTKSIQKDRTAEYFAWHFVIWFLLNIYPEVTQLIMKMSPSKHRGTDKKSKFTEKHKRFFFPRGRLWSKWKYLLFAVRTHTILEIRAIRTRLDSIAATIRRKYEWTCDAGWMETITPHPEIAKSHPDMRERTKNVNNANGKSLVSITKRLNKQKCVNYVSINWFRVRIVYWIFSYSIPSASLHTPPLPPLSFNLSIWPNMCLD